MKTVVVYKSKTGFVKKYAEWIAEELHADLFEAGTIKPEKLASYDAIVYGGGLYVGGINGVKLITNNLHMLKGKRIAVFGTGAAPGRPEVLTEVRDQNFSAEDLKYLRYFYMRGGFDYGKLPPVQKILMTLLKWKIEWKKKRKVPLHGDESGMLHAYGKPANFTQRKNISELVKYMISE